MLTVDSRCFWRWMKWNNLTCKRAKDVQKVGILDLKEDSSRWHQTSPVWAQEQVCLSSLVGFPLRGSRSSLTLSPERVSSGLRTSRDHRGEHFLQALPFTVQPKSSLSWLLGQICCLRPILRTPNYFFSSQVFYELQVFQPCFCLYLHFLKFLLKSFYLLSCCINIGSCSMHWWRPSRSALRLPMSCWSFILISSWALISFLSSCRSISTSFLAGFTSDSHLQLSSLSESLSCFLKDLDGLWGNLPWDKRQSWSWAYRGGRVLRGNSPRDNKLDF